VSESGDKEHLQAKLDLPGQLVSVVALASITFVLLEAKTLGLGSPMIVSAIVLGLVGLMAFVAIERHVTRPMVPLAFFKNRSFSAANLVGFWTNFAIYGWLFVISLYFQQVRHFSPLLTGLAILPWGAAGLVTAIFSGRVTAARGPRLPMLVGTAVGVLALLAQLPLSQTLAVGWMIVPFIAFGFGMSFTMPAMTVAVISHAPRARASTSSGIVNAGRQLGASFGVALLGGFLVTFGPVSGFRVGMLVAAGAFLLSLAAAYFSVHNVSEG
jgi:DHA2 family methylenomycin A resistance protein-like MFS transporter